MFYFCSTIAFCLSFTLSVLDLFIFWLQVTTHIILTFFFPFFFSRLYFVTFFFFFQNLFFYFPLPSTGNKKDYCFYLQRKQFYEQLWIVR